MNLSDSQIEEMAHAALMAYELACSWGAAYRAAADHAQDEWGVRARDSAVRLAVRIAQTQWQEAVRYVQSLN